MRNPASLLLLLAAALAACNDLHVGTGAGTKCAADADCATGLVCLDGLCRLPESSGTCTPNERRCDGRRVLVCSRDGSAFAEQAICELRCHDGECVEKTCTSGELTCEGDTLTRCANDGSGRVPVEACALGCDPEKKACRPPACRAGESRCADSGTAVEQCDTRGSAWVKAKCDVVAPGRCVLGEGPAGPEARCVTRACEPGAVRCEGAKVVVCDAQGQGEVVRETCELGCSTGACVARTCTPGARRCVANGLEICPADGRTFVLAESCPAGCVADGGARCRALVCAPNALRCADPGRVQACAPDGSAWEAQTACGAGEACSEGACVAPPAECVEGSLRCSGRQVVACEGGRSVTRETCLGACVAGACDARGECVAPVLDVALAVDGDVFPADGVSSFLLVSRPIASSDGRPIAEGSSITLGLATTGADVPAVLLAPDADAALPGVQVRVLGGRIDFTIRAPKSPSREASVTVTAAIAGQAPCSAAAKTLRFGPAGKDRWVADDFLTQRSRDPSKGTGATWDTQAGALEVGAFDAGDGRDGELVVAAGETVDLSTRQPAGRTFPDMASLRVLEIRGDRLVLEDAPIAFGPGTRALLVNLRGAAGKTKAVGTWELVTIAGEDRGLVKLSSQVTRTYGEPDNGAAALATQAVWLVRLPQYARVAIDGTVTGPAWEGTRGGLLGFFAQATATTGPERNRLGATGLVTMKGRGYRGGSAPGTPTSSLSGESLAGGRDTSGVEPQIGAGGGGYTCGTGTAPVVAANAPPPGNSASAFFGSAGSHASAGESTCGRAGQTYATTTSAKVFLGSGSGSQHESVYFACPQHRQCCTQYKACRCDQYASCCTQYNSCCTQYNTCCTAYNSCCYQNKSCCRLRQACVCTAPRSCRSKDICGCEFGHCCGFACLGGCDGCNAGSGAASCTDARCGCDAFARGDSCTCESGYDGRHPDCGCELNGPNVACGCAPGANKPDATCGCAPGKDGPQAACGCAPGKDGPQAACGCAIALARDVTCGCEDGADKRDASCGCEPREDKWKSAYGGAAGGGLVFIVAGALDLSADGARVDVSGDDPVKGAYGGAGGTVVIRAASLALGGSGRIVAAGGARAGVGRVWLETGAVDATYVAGWTTPAATRSVLELPAAWSIKVADFLPSSAAFAQVRMLALPLAPGAGDTGLAPDPVTALAASGAAISVSVDPNSGWSPLPAESSVAVGGRALFWSVRAAPGLNATRVRGLAFRLVDAP